MLFSDIEGSTVLLNALGDRYGEALSAQRALLRAAFSSFGGREMGTEGDSFFVVFETAADAVACCLAAQRALAAHDWPGGDAVRVRMGLHSGEPTRHEDGYIGMDVHRAARIAATAHGGQVVLSEVTLQQAGPLPEGASVRDLGFHRLKDISAPERIYQLAGPENAEERIFTPAQKALWERLPATFRFNNMVAKLGCNKKLLAAVVKRASSQGLLEKYAQTYYKNLQLRGNGNLEIQTEETSGYIEVSGECEVETSGALDGNR